MFPAAREPPGTGLESRFQPFPRDFSRPRRKDTYAANALTSACHEINAGIGRIPTIATHTAYPPCRQVRNSSPIIHLIRSGISLGREKVSPLSSLTISNGFRLSSLRSLCVPFVPFDYFRRSPYALFRRRSGYSPCNYCLPSNLRGHFLGTIYSESDMISRGEPTCAVISNKP